MSANDRSNSSSQTVWNKKETASAEKGVYILSNENFIYNYFCVKSIHNNMFKISVLMNLKEFNKRHIHMALFKCQNVNNFKNL